MPGLILSMCDSWTLVLTCILLMSGKAEDLLTLAHLRPFLDLRLAAAEGPAGIVGVDDESVAGRLDLAGGDLPLELLFLAGFQVPGRLLRELIRVGFLDFALELLDGLVPWCIPPGPSSCSGLLEGEPGLLERQLFRDFWLARET